jgi:hypothetical protein
VADEPEARGVSNPRVVDLIARDDARGEVVLTMLEVRPWESDPDQLRQLEEKFNAYLAYVQGGHLAEQYPEYEGLLVCFHLDCSEAPRGEAQRMLRAMQNFAEAEGIRLVVRVIQPAGQEPA